MDVVKHIADSKTEYTEILIPAHLNGMNRLRGGQLMEWIDVVSAVVARRHSSSDVTTALIENVEFLAPAYVNDTVLVKGFLTYVGRTSMEVCVELYDEKLDGSRSLINRAFVIMVALDEKGKPREVPRLEYLSEAEENLREDALKRAERRK